MASLPVRLVLGRKIRSLWFDILTLFFHWIDYAFFLIIVEGMSFTVRNQTKFRYCVTVAREHLHSPECNAVYATIAFAGIDLLLSFISAIFVTLAIQCYCWSKYKDRFSNGNVQRISSPDEPGNQVNEEG